MMLHNKYQGSRLCGFREEDFFLSSLYKSYIKHVSLGRDHLTPESIFEQTW